MRYINDFSNNSEPEFQDYQDHPKRSFVEKLQDHDRRLRIHLACMDALTDLVRKEQSLFEIQSSVQWMSCGCSTRRRFVREYEAIVNDVRIERKILSAIALDKMFRGKQAA
jgi:hypothetical protein